jgi:hypothetical protein
MVARFSARCGSGTGIVLLLAGILPAGPILHPSDKLTDDEKIALVRDLSAEYAKATTMIPRSSKPLEIHVDGTRNTKGWSEAATSNGIAARVGDQVQITKITLEGDAILFEINGGLRNGKRFMDHVQIGMGTPRPVTNGTGNATTGTTLELKFPKPMESLTSDDVKKILVPFLDFDKRSATRLYSETLPPEVQHAIAEKRALEGMTREQVLMALGHPEHKYRESKEGVDTEDWIYGRAPGKITFVTFGGSKVVKVKEEYAGLGIETAEQKPTP